MSSPGLDVLDRIRVELIQNSNVLADITGRLERGYKSDSYIFAIENNAIPLQKRHFEDVTITSSELLICNSHLGTLNAEQLDKYRDDPFWKRLRWSLLIGFWLVWILLIFTALFMVFSSPKCAEYVSRKWWETGVFYEIWTNSFQDSNGDGYGDLKGVQARLNELRKIGVNTIFPRQFLDTEESGVGAQNFVGIEPSIGSIKDAIELIEEAQSRDFHAVIDFPLIVTSITHKWFRRSAAASLPENVGYASFYYWRRNAQASEYVTEYQNSTVSYFHVKNRPDLPVLNWYSSNVSLALKNALSFWIDRGVDGFHLSSIEYLHRSIDGLDPEWDGILAVIKEITSFISGYAKESMVAKEKDIFIFASPENTKEEYKNRLVKDGGLSAVVNTELTQVALKNKICYESENSVAGCVNEILSDLLLFHAANRLQHIWPMWITGNSFTSRLATRVGSRNHGELITMLQLILPGTNIFYYGEEIGLRDVADNLEFPQRAHNFLLQYIMTIKFQLHDSRLARLRARSDLLLFGRTYITKVMNHGFCLCRYLMSEDNSTYTQVLVAVVNFGKTTQKQSLLDLPPFQNNEFDKSVAEVVVVGSTSDSYCPYQKIDISKRDITLKADEGVVFMIS
uniref:alpha-glucosidase n=1 Tax=Ditylenchus dipsaci TaxID=166011 RepID=A0A915DEY3_9BILA